MELKSNLPSSAESEENDDLLVLLSYLSIYQGIRNAIPPMSSMLPTHREKVNKLGVLTYAGEIRDEIFSLIHMAPHLRSTSPAFLKTDLKIARLIKARNGAAFKSITPPILSTKHSPNDILHHASKIPQFHLDYQSVGNGNVNTVLGLLIAQLAGNRGEIILIEQMCSIPAIAMWCVEHHRDDLMFILTRFTPVPATRPPDIRHSRRSRPPRRRCGYPCRSRSSERSCSSRSSRSTSAPMERPPSPLLRDAEGLHIVIVCIILSSMLFRGSLCRIGVLLCIVGLLCGTGSR
ncbi:unnamed protein product [Fusarium langsethiae]|nr:unnamed protein product [Fusarium langsethiae]